MMAGNIQSSVMDLYLATDLIGFLTGLVVSVLFLVLAVRSLPFPGATSANVYLGVFALIWNGAGVANSLTVALGQYTGGDPSSPFVAIELLGALAWPIPALAIWRRLSRSRWQRLACTTLQIVAVAGLVAAAVGFLDPRLPVTETWSFGQAKDLATRFISLFCFALLIIGASILIMGRLERPVRLSFSIVLVGILGASGALFLHQLEMLPRALDLILLLFSKQSTLLILFGSFLLFADFRFADIFIRHGMRVLLTAAMAVLVIVMVRIPLRAEAVGGLSSHDALWISASVLIACVFLWFFPFVDSAVDRFVSERIFQVPDYAAALQSLDDALSRSYEESEISAAAAGIVGATLGVRGVKLLIRQEPADADGVHVEFAGEISEVGGRGPHATKRGQQSPRYLVPIQGGDPPGRVLLISPDRGRRALVTREFAFLRAAALRLGQRLDSLRLEQERVERQSRETLLLQQLSDAELRALRAQINPHFLFNSLNTIADLIVGDPGQAETMTLRLAQVFRHVLSRSSQPLTSVAEEIEFIRSYLSIEEARFGTRLRFEFEVSADVMTERIPTLILQPIVENALRHGLAPHPGPGLLRICANRQNGRVCLTVEDDGVGPNGTKDSRRSGDPSGVGLKNVAERLRTMYRDGAEFSLGPGEVRGSRVRIILPA
jgi:two-component system, LytTR family, sensor kinase